MFKFVLFVLIILCALDLISVVESYHHNECGESPSLKFKKLAKFLGKLKFLICLK